MAVDMLCQLHYETRRIVVINSILIINGHKKSLVSDCKSYCWNKDKEELTYDVMPQFCTFCSSSLCEHVFMYKIEMYNGRTGDIYGHFYD